MSSMAIGRGVEVFVGKGLGHVYCTAGTEEAALTLSWFGECKF